MKSQLRGPTAISRKPLPSTAITSPPRILTVPRTAQVPSMWMWAISLAKPSSAPPLVSRSEEHTSELQSLMSISYAVFCLKKKKITQLIQDTKQNTDYYKTKKQK